MSSRLIALSVFILLSFPIFGQTLSEISRAQIPFEPALVSIDRQGYLYIANSEGTISKLSNDGEVRSTFSPQKRGKPKILETWQGLRVFVYYQNFQEYILLNRFLSNENRINTALDDFAPFTGLATLSNDNNLWLWNDREMLLTKRDINNQEIIVETQLNLNTDFENIQGNHMRAYQSYVFLSTNNGILLFDNLGNYIDQLNTEEVDFFGFADTELYFLKDKTISLISIEDKTKREIRLPELPKLVLMENNQVYAFKGKNLIIYDIN